MRAVPGTSLRLGSLNAPGLGLEPHVTRLPCCSLFLIGDSSLLGRAGLAPLLLKGAGAVCVATFLGVIAQCPLRQRALRPAVPGAGSMVSGCGLCVRPPSGMALSHRQLMAQLSARASGLPDDPPDLAGTAGNTSSLSICSWCSVQDKA